MSRGEFLEAFDYVFTGPMKHLLTLLELPLLFDGKVSHSGWPAVF
jgi:hypothetical protein